MVGYLLYLRNLQQVALLDEAAHLTHERHVLGHVTRLRAELGVVLDEALHISDALDVLVAEP